MTIVTMRMDLGEREDIAKQERKINTRLFYLQALYGNKLDEMTNKTRRNPGILTSEVNLPEGQKAPYGSK